MQSCHHRGNLFWCQAHLGNSVHRHRAGVSQIDRIVEAVEETLKGNRIHMLVKKSLPRLDLPKVPPRCVSLILLCRQCFFYELGAAESSASCQVLLDRCGRTGTSRLFLCPR